ncbi:MAG: hypothetical protein Q4D74_04895 [Comamonadaceae bacterium]|nr:hypothetical protein [Comamonadaceae bacterium]
MSRTRAFAASAALAAALPLAATAQTATPEAASAATVAPAPTTAATPRSGRLGATGGWEWGAVLDAAASSRELALGQRAKGLALGHSDVTLKGPVTRHAEAQFTAAVHQHDGKVEGEIEEAWLQTRTLPAGLQLRAGRFASQLGYLNEQHPHADDFVERPLLYRAFLGGHWFDDGLRLNWTAPTDLYLRLGAEVFTGKQLIQEAAHARQPGATVLSARVGGDLGRAHSWQAGLAWLHNRREAAPHDHDHHHGHHDHDHSHGGHAHAHGAAFSGKNLWLGDITWKWAPGGNNRNQQVRVTYERALVRGLGPHARRRDHHVADYLSAVWRFHPAWEAGVRSDMMRVRIPHGDHFHAGRLREAAVMLAYKPTHMQSLRLQFTRQYGAKGFEGAGRAVQLQYVISFGAHGAHSF